MSDDRDATTGRFLPGNRFWEARSSHGIAPKFETADDLWSACVEYFEWNAENPLYEMRPFAYQGVVVQEAVAKMRAMTIGGLCLFLDVVESTWRAWRTKGHVLYRPDFEAVITRAEAIIRKQKFEGASADLLNANIIARDLGLADRSELTGRDGGPIEVDEVKMTDREVARRVAFLLAKGLQEDEE
jgi:hypothetical protein